MRLALRNSKNKHIFQVLEPLHLENPFFRNINTILVQRTDYWEDSCN